MKNEENTTGRDEESVNSGNEQVLFKNLSHEVCFNPVIFFCFDLGCLIIY